MSRAPRYAQRKDSNEAVIVAALRASGATVLISQLPFDLTVSARCANGEMAMAYFEVKNSKTGYGRKGMKNGGSENQKKFLESNDMPVFFVDSVNVALALLKEMQS